MGKDAAVPLLRTSERSTYKKCLWAWDQSYNQLLKPRVEVPALRFGTLIHKALEKRYPKGVKRGPHPAKTFERLYVKELEHAETFGFRDEDGTWHDALEIGVAMMNGYVDRFGTDEDYKVLGTEQPFQVPVLHPRTGGKLWFYYVGTFDGVWEHRSKKEIWIPDYKTCASINLDHLPLDEQAGSYWTYGTRWLLQVGILKPKRDIAGMLYTFMRKALPDERPTNAEGQHLNKPTKEALVVAALSSKYKKKLKGADPERLTISQLTELIGEQAAEQLGEVSKTQPPPLFLRHHEYRDQADRERLEQRVLDEMREMAMRRKGKLAIFKSPNTMNCKPCGFKDICELHETGNDWKAMRDATMEPWEPYSVHAIEDAELR